MRKRVAGQLIELRKELEFVKGQIAAMEHVARMLDSEHDTQVTMDEKSLRAKDMLAKVAQAPHPEHGKVTAETPSDYAARVNAYDLHNLTRYQYRHTCGGIAFLSHNKPEKGTPKQFGLLHMRHTDGSPIDPLKPIECAACGQRVVPNADSFEDYKHGQR